MRRDWILVPSCFTLVLLWASIGALYYYNTQNYVMYALLFFLVMVNTMFLLYLMELISFHNINKVLNYLYTTLLVVFFGSIVATALGKDAMSYFNIYYFIAVILALGAFLLLTNKDEERESKGFSVPLKLDINLPSNFDHAFIVVMSVIGAVVIWYKTRQIGDISYLVSVLGGALIAALSMLILEEDEDELEDEKGDSKDSKTADEMSKEWIRFEKKLELFVKKAQNSNSSKYFSLYKEYNEINDVYLEMLHRIKADPSDRKLKDGINEKLDMANDIIKELDKKNWVS